LKFLAKQLNWIPNYARAQAFLANSYIGLATIFGAELSALEALDKGKPLIDKALSLDPDLDEAHMLMGFYYLYRDWDFAKAESEYKQSNCLWTIRYALALYADFLNFMGRHDEAMAVAERLNIRDPYYPQFPHALGLFLQ
jgi:Tfp pilus assembly protein PilF